MRRSARATIVLPFVLLFGIAALRPAAAAPPEADFSNLRGVDLDGVTHQFSRNVQTRATIVVFLSTKCPISNETLPDLNRIAERADSRGVEIFGVVSDPAVTRTEAKKHHAEFRIRFPVLFDASLGLRRQLKPTHTPEVFLFGPEMQLAYRGRINDRYAALGQKKVQSSRNDLLLALTSVIKGEKPEESYTRPIGCLLEDPPDPASRSDVTFTRDVAPIILSQCASCHRPGEAAPFSLLTYEDVSAHARQICEVTASGFMPPWKATEGYGEFQGERRLSADEKAILQAWVDGGKQRGDPQDLPPTPKFPQGWQLGKPDLILEMPETFTIGPTGRDIHQHFVLPSGLTRNRLVAAVEFRPGTPQVVHHACCYIDPSRAARVLDAADPLPGYGGFGGPGFSAFGGFRCWLPGSTPRPLPQGMGRLMPAGSDVVMEIHYKRTGKVETDRSKIGIYFAPPSARQVVLELQILSYDLEIPAGAKRHHMHAEYTLPGEAVLLDGAPHMHLLGREIRARAVKPDGKIVPLLWVKDWDFNWQENYLFKRPIRLPAGTRIELDAWYDNSKDNPLNPNSPPKLVTWGETSTDEMGLCYFRYTCDNYADIVKLNKHFQSYYSNLVMNKAKNHPERNPPPPEWLTRTVIEDVFNAARPLPGGNRQRRRP